jgi:hypothetical protein
MSLSTATSNIVDLFKANGADGAVSDSVRRSQFVYNSIYVTYSDGSAGTVTFDIQVTAADDGNSDFVTIQTAVAIPAYVVLPPGIYGAVRLKKTAGSTRPINARIASGGSAR